jgi:hypothetical protein
MASKTTNPEHEHPQTAIPVRVAKESSFTAPASTVPAETQRPARAAGTPQGHPLSRPIRTENESLIGPQLGRGGTEGPGVAPVDATCVYADPGFTGDPDEKFVPGADPALAKADANFEDVSALLMRPRGGATNA